MTRWVTYTEYHHSLPRSQRAVIALRYASRELWLYSSMALASEGQCGRRCPLFAAAGFECFAAGTRLVDYFLLISACPFKEVGR